MSSGGLLLIGVSLRLFVIALDPSIAKAGPRGTPPKPDIVDPPSPSRVQAPRNLHEVTRPPRSGARLEAEYEELALIPKDKREVPPSFPADLEWVRSMPLTLEMLRGKVVLVEVWESSCINCLRTLPVLSRLQARYGYYGLVVIGIHSPEFAFTKGRAAVEKAARRFGLEFPVASDTSHTFWKSWDVHGWPTSFLLDARGLIANMHQGELMPTTSERRVRALLREARSDLALPEPHSSPADEDPYGPECGFVTPEISITAGRDFLLNPEGYRPGQTVVYADPGLARREGTFYLSGPWSWIRNGLQRGSGGVRASIGITYTGKEVYSVLANAGAALQEVEIRQDGKALTEANKGRDVEIALDGRSIIRLAESRLHYLVVNPDVGRHDVELFPSSPFFQIHSFSFCNRCQTDFPHR